MNNIIIIYTSQNTSRLTYTCKLIFNTLLNTNFVITTNLNEYNNSTYIPVNYSNNNKIKGLQINPNKLLFETGIKKQNFEIKEWQNLKIFYISDSEWPFDIFAATFFLVSRYEEYNSSFLDTHGRFIAKESIAFKNNFLKYPIVNKWVLLFADALRLKYNFNLVQNEFCFIPTIDIDIAYAFKNKGFKRTLLTCLKSLLKLEFNNLITCIKVTVFNHHDPYDTFELIRKIHLNNKFKTQYFFLVGKKSRFDRNLNFNKKINKELIKTIEKYDDIGLHPSYYSEVKGSLKFELKLLNKISEHPIKNSRFHFLKFQIPNSYLNLCKNGIEHDYTMGYASQLGFRAGICTPYQFYNIENESECKLTIHPFAVMDGTLNEYLKYSIEDSIEAVKNIINEIKSVNGTFYCIWHNTSLSEQGIWKDWTKTYTELVNYANLKH